MNIRNMETFLNLYRSLKAENLDTLQEVYSENIRFIDPAHEIRGLEELTTYFRGLYSNVKSINFDFSSPIMVNASGSVRWKMTFSHRGLAGGRPIQVDGASFVEFDRDGKVYFHRDYFDLGAMLYEHIPLLGRFVLFTKERLGT